MQQQPHRRNTSPKKRRRFRLKRLILTLALMALVIIGLIKLIDYGSALIAAQQSSRRMQDIYYAQPTDAPTATPEPEPEPDPTPALTAAWEQTPVTDPPLAELVLPTKAPVQKLSSIPYPENAELRIDSRFKALRKENKDVVGWLSVGQMLGEAVVQRDNIFYLDHDLSGSKNVNGAIFMDAFISLKTRPYTLILYGHNMKSGAMFGSLRNFENPTFYHNDPFLSFDSMYENGRYVIFAAGQISVEEYGQNYVNFFDLDSKDKEIRRDAINTLMESSVWNCTIDVQPEDQILLLVTCTEQDMNRRVVAARRIRDWESESQLKPLAQSSALK